MFKLKNKKETLPHKWPSIPKLEMRQKGKLIHIIFWSTLPSVEKLSSVASIMLCLPRNVNQRIKYQLYLEIQDKIKENSFFHFLGFPVVLYFEYLPYFINNAVNWKSSRYLMTNWQLWANYLLYKLADFHCLLVC